MEATKLNKSQALQELRKGKKVRIGNKIFKAISEDKNIIVDEEGFNYTEYFKLYNNNEDFELV